MTYYLIASLCLLVFYLLYELFLKAEKSMNLQRAYLLLAVAFSLLIPLIKVDWNSNNYVQAVQAYLPSNSTSGNTVEAGSSFADSLNWFKIIVFAYGFGVLMMLIRLIRSGYKLVRTIRDGKIVRDGKIKLVYTKTDISISSFFNYIFISDHLQFTEEELKSVLIHERKHFSDKHSVDILLMELLKVIFWFNPAIYLIDNAIKSVHEYVSDQEATKHCGVPNYERLLVSVLFRGFNIPLTSQFSEVSVKKRIYMLNQRPSTLMKKTKFLLFIPITLVLVWACSNSEVNAYDELQSRNITGRIINSEGKTLPGVNIVVEGTTIGAVSDIEGNYTLTVPAGGKSLVYSFIGMKTQIVEVNGYNEIDVELTNE